MITLKQAKALEYRDVIVDERDGKRWYVTGKVQTLKTDETRIRVPLKHGLYSYGALDTADFQRNNIDSRDQRYTFDELFECPYFTKE